VRRPRREEMLSAFVNRDALAPRSGARLRCLTYNILRREPIVNGVHDEHLTACPVSIPVTTGKEFQRLPLLEPPPTIGIDWSFSTLVLAPHTASGKDTVSPSRRQARRLAARKVTATRRRPLGSTIELLLSFTGYSQRRTRAL
jgi:hypothetical protein